MIFYRLPASVMLVAQSLDPTILPQCSRLPADLAVMEGLLFGAFDALADGVVRMVPMDAQASEFLLHLQYFEPSNWRPPARSISVTNASKSPHSRQRMSNQPSP